MFNGIKVYFFDLLTGWGELHLKIYFLSSKNSLWFCFYSSFVNNSVLFCFLLLFKIGLLYYISGESILFKLGLFNKAAKFLRDVFLTIAFFN